MFREKEIVRGFVKDIHPPKPKFLITLYRDENLHILACFTTSKHRCRVAPGDLAPGVVKFDNEPVAYFFERGQEIGLDPRDGSRFAFPDRTLVPFNYCIQEGTLDTLLSRLVDPEVVCVLDDEHYENLLYAMYRSEDVPKKYIPVLEKALEAYFANR